MSKLGFADARFAFVEWLDLHPDDADRAVDIYNGREDDSVFIAGYMSAVEDMKP